MNQFAPPVNAAIEPVATPAKRWKPIVIIVAVVALVAGVAWWQGERQADNRQDDLDRSITQLDD